MAKTPSSKATIDKLRKENTRLEAEVARLQTLAIKPELPSAPKQRSINGIIRKVVVILCMVLAVVLLVLGNLFFWAGNTVVNQQRFDAAMAPVIKDQQVQQTLALYTTNQIFASINVQQYIAGILPPRADFLAPQLAGQVRGFTQTGLQKALATPRLQQTWNSVTSKQHQRLITFAENYQGNGTISLNDVFQQLTAGLRNTKLAFLSGKQLPSNVGSITLVTASWLPLLHDLITHIGTWRTLSIIGLIIFAGVAIWLSRKRRRTIYLLCLFASLGLVISLVILRAAREHLIDTINPAYASGVASALHIFFHGLVVQTLTIIAALIIIGFIAWISGNATSATTTKRFTRTLFTEKLHTLLFAEENAVTKWISSHRQLLEWCAVALFILLSLLVRLTVKTLVVLVILLLLVVFIIEIASNQAKRVPNQKT